MVEPGHPKRTYSDLWAYAYENPKSLYDPKQTYKL